MLTTEIAQQGESLATLLHQNGISGEQAQKLTQGGPLLERLIADLKGEKTWTERLYQEADKSKKNIHILSPYDPDRNILEKILVDGDNKKRYPFGGHIVLVSHKDQDLCDHADIVKWALDQGLERTVPHDLYRCHEQNNNLDYSLGYDVYKTDRRVFLIETQGCMSETSPNAFTLIWSCVWKEHFVGWHEKTVQHERWFGDKRKRDQHWFAFRKTL